MKNSDQYTLYEKYQVQFIRVWATDQIYNSGKKKPVAIVITTGFNIV